LAYVNVWRLGPIVKLQHLIARTSLWPQGCSVQSQSPPVCARCQVLFQTYATLHIMAENRMPQEEAEA
jgi:hypothetical protein